MIDWLTLKLDRALVPNVVYDRAKARNGMVMCITPLARDNPLYQGIVELDEVGQEKQRRAYANTRVIVDGDGVEVFRGMITWEKVSRESIGSDSHKLVVEAAPHCLWIYGSPARVSQVNNVFGKECIRECALDMIKFAARHLECILPTHLESWQITRADVTQNYDLGSAAEVRQALSYLRQSEGGRLQVSTKSETIYWGKDSSLRKMKAYHKGPQLLKQVKQNKAQATPEEIDLSQRLLRLELTLGNQFWRERSPKPWYDYEAHELEQMHQQYFGQVIGKMEITEMEDIRTQLIEAAQRLNWSEGTGLAAYRTWCQIKSMGLREVEDTMPASTWRRHKSIMFEAGMTYADFHAQNIIPFRRRTIELGSAVTCWDDMRIAA
jgi:II/X family phage/plasmid replication protein